MSKSIKKYTIIAAACILTAFTTGCEKEKEEPLPNAEIELDMDDILQKIDKAEREEFEEKLDSLDHIEIPDFNNKDKENKDDNDLFDENEQIDNKETEDGKDIWKDEDEQTIPGKHLVNEKSEYMEITGSGKQYKVSDLRGDELTLTIDADNIQIKVYNNIATIKGTKNGKEGTMKFSVYNEKELESKLEAMRPLSFRFRFSEIVEYKNEKLNQAVSVAWPEGSHFGLMITENTLADFITECENPTSDFLPDYLDEDLSAFESEYTSEAYNAMKPASKKIPVKCGEKKATLYLNDIRKLEVEEQDDAIVVSGMTSFTAMGEDTKYNDGKMIVHVLDEEGMDKFFKEYGPLDEYMSSSSGSVSILLLTDPTKSIYDAPMMIKWEKGNNLGLVIEGLYGNLTNEWNGDALISHVKLDVESKNADSQYLPEVFKHGGKYDKSKFDYSKNDDIKISDEWTDMEFVMDGRKYSANKVDFNELIENEWNLEKGAVLYVNKNDECTRDFFSHGVAEGPIAPNAIYEHLCVRSRKYGVSLKAPYVMCTYDQSDKTTALQERLPIMISVNALRKNKNGNYVATKDPMYVIMPQGIKMDDSFETVTAAYGKNYKVVEDDKIKIIQYTDNNANLWITFMDGKAKSFAFGSNTEMKPLIPEMQ